MLGWTVSTSLAGGNEFLVSAVGQAQGVHCKGVLSTSAGMVEGLQGAHRLPETAGQFLGMQILKESRVHSLYQLLNRESEELLPGLSCVGSVIL